MHAEADIKFMRRCLDLALKAEGATYPNPLVGSVIVHDGQIIGEGYHLKAGQGHAEVNAIASVSKKQLLPASTLYVNLEPCSHYGKTPPCADLIISSGIRKVVIGTKDTNKEVSGKGIEKLISAGCAVVYGVLETESRFLNKRFFTFHESKRPYITLKWAQSADGFIDKLRAEDDTKGPNWISGKTERVLVHRWRATEQAILVGAGTVRADNPGLNVRDWAGNDPVRLVLSRSGELDSNARIFNANGTNIVFTHSDIALNGNTEVVRLDSGRSSVLQIVEYLYSTNVQSLMVEGGADTLSQFISEGLWDEAKIFTGNKSFGKGLAAPAINGHFIERTCFEHSKLEVILKD